MAGGYNIVTKDSISVLISTSIEEKCIPIEKHFKKDITVKDLKDKLEVITGASSATMIVKVYNDDKLVCSLDADDKLIGSFHIDDGMRLHVEDNFALRKSLEDESNAEKYNMPLEEYSQRTDTLKAFLEKNKIGKYNPEETARREAAKKQEEEAEEAIARNLKIGNRCEVTIPGNPTRRAEVMFVGKTQFKPGWWVGVKYDEPMGKNDGSVGGVKYFECLPKYGGFVKPISVKVGDFPEEDLGLDDEI